MFGLQDNDAPRFPLAVREVIDLDGKVNVPVHSSRSILTLRRTDGAGLRHHAREILGDPADVLSLRSWPPITPFWHTSQTRKTRQTMMDEAAGFAELPLCLRAACHAHHDRG